MRLEWWHEGFHFACCTSKPSSSHINRWSLLNSRGQNVVFISAYSGFSLFSRDNFPGLFQRGTCWYHRPGVAPFSNMFLSNFKDYGYTYVWDHLFPIIVIKVNVTTGHESWPKNESMLKRKGNIDPLPVSETYCTGSFLGSGSILPVVRFSLGDLFDFLAGSSSSESAQTERRGEVEEQRSKTSKRRPQLIKKSSIWKTSVFLKNNSLTLC